MIVQFRTVLHNISIDESYTYILGPLGEPPYEAVDERTP